MTGAEREVILAISPHLDDAVMAAGATMAALADAGQRVVVCTVFAGQPLPPLSPVATAFHADCGLGDDAVDRRMDEDLRALKIVGAEAVHLTYLDAIYRRRGNEWLCTNACAMFDPSLPIDPVLRASISAEIVHLIQVIRPTAVWTCDVTGGHVDHRMTHIAVVEATETVGQTLVVWEGLPYAIGSEAPTDVRLLTDASVRDMHLERKTAAIAQYTSQIKVLWPGVEEWRTLFFDHARSRAVLGALELLLPPPSGSMAVRLSEGVGDRA